MAAARIRGWIKHLERAATGEIISIPQLDGTVRCFHPDELPKAYLSAFDLALGKDVESHPMLAAIRNSSDPHWRGMWDDLLGGVSTAPASLEDLSE